MADESLYLGLDLSTQQLKAIVISSTLKVVHEANVHFDSDLPGYGVKNGVHVNDREHEVFAPVAMWLEATDLVLQRLHDQGLDFGRVQGVSGAGQQHGSVYWGQHAEQLLQALDHGRTLKENLAENAFSHPNSPNWQDASTQTECDRFDEHLGGGDTLARVTGSKAHHRFTGPQILRFRKKYPEAYHATSHISLVSSFLASLFLGKIAPIDIGDVCGMNLWDIKTGAWNEELITLAAGPEGLTDLRQKLGDVEEDGGAALGNVAKYFVNRYGFDARCTVLPFTGDNPSTILALPLRQDDALVSLGTSTTFLMSTPKYSPDPSYHFMNHPTTAGLYMFMLCYKNGSRGREDVRSAINEVQGAAKTDDDWGLFDECLANSKPMQKHRTKTDGAEDAVKMGLYFPLPEIVPNVREGVWRYNYVPQTSSLRSIGESWRIPVDDARAIVESQIFSLRLRSQRLMATTQGQGPPQPRRVYITGGGSRNMMIAKMIGEILGGTEGVYQLDVGGSGCALGAAHKAVWGTERKAGETFEDLIGARWNEKGAISKVHEGYQAGLWEEYGAALPGFEQMENQVIHEDQELQRLKGTLKPP
ncbi:MAG: hypothetical protein M1833_004962 [Piccolia ochrophora]|nr:MAG: hypothetical protein M1833_004962 [Piccolia ochrophora]